jgi:hypothetical protein
MVNADRGGELRGHGRVYRVVWDALEQGNGRMTARVGAGDNKLVRD